MNTTANNVLHRIEHAQGNWQALPQATTMREALLQNLIVRVREIESRTLVADEAIRLDGYNAFPSLDEMLALYRDAANAIDAHMDDDEVGSAMLDALFLETEALAETIAAMYGYVGDSRRRVISHIGNWTI